MARLPPNLLPLLRPTLSEKEGAPLCGVKELQASSSVVLMSVENTLHIQIEDEHNARFGVVERS